MRSVQALCALHRPEVRKSDRSGKPHQVLWTSGCLAASKFYGPARGNCWFSWAQRGRQNHHLEDSHLFHATHIGNSSGGWAGLPREFPRSQGEDWISSGKCTPLLGYDHPPLSCVRRGCKRFIPRSGKTRDRPGNGSLTITSVAERIIGNLSKGYRQRIGIAQALLNDPPILILDEPTLGLDPTQIVEIRSLIRELGAERTIILSSHILPEVSQICQRILIINNGQIIATDTPSNLTAQLQRNLQVYLEVEGPKAEVVKKINSMGGVLSVTPANGPGSYLIETSRGQDLRPKLARTVVEHGWELRELRLQDLSLEDIFMQLVTDE